MTAHAQLRLRPREQQSSASKVLSVLTAMLRSDHGVASLTAVALAVGLPKSTTHRLLRELEEQAFVERAGSHYRLGDTFLDRAETARWSSYADLRDVAYPSLARLFEESRAVAVHLAVLRGRSVHYVDKLMGAAGVRIPTRVGGGFPATCTGLGKAMLADGPSQVLRGVLSEPLPRATPYSVAAPSRLLGQLHRARNVGFVVETEEACHGFVCVAASIVSQGDPIAAISIALPTLTVRRQGPAHVARLGRLVAMTARSVGDAVPTDGPAGEVPAAGTVHSHRRSARLDCGSSNWSTVEES